jgi:DNA replicative helicase MCM subunit Mcm2 (Cdc46/Mcm family)
MCNSDKIRSFTPGNELRCTGILKEVPIKKGKEISPHLNWIFEINGAELIEKDIEIKNITEEEQEQINLLSKKIDEEGLEAITSSFCPEVFGYESIKKALILQLCNKRNDRKNNAIRNKSNILLIGDPGVAKSVLCNFAVDIMPGARKAVGGGSSAVGITASVIKEEESMGGYRVEPGAMVLAKDLLFLDELNNLQDEDKPKLQEGMNEMTISIDKANIHVKMPVTGGIISCANPQKGHFIMDGSTTVQEQFNIPTPILNRFDTIFVINDIVDEEKDKAIAKSMLLRHRGLLQPTYKKDFLRLFFSYIKQVEEPTITEEISKKMGDVYSEVRKTKNSGVKINPRFLESMTRMVIASAKIRQSRLVEEKDIERALAILSESQYNIVNKT